MAKTVGKTVDGQVSDLLCGPNFPSLRPPTSLGELRIPSRGPYSQVLCLIVKSLHAFVLFQEALEILSFFTSGAVKLRLHHEALPPAFFAPTCHRPLSLSTPLAGKTFFRVPVFSPNYKSSFPFFSLSCLANILFPSFSLSSRFLSLFNPVPSRRASVCDMTGRHSSSHALFHSLVAVSFSPGAFICCSCISKGRGDSWGPRLFQ